MDQEIPSSAAISFLNGLAATVLVYSERIFGQDRDDDDDDDWDVDGDANDSSSVRHSCGRKAALILGTDEAQVFDLTGHSEEGANLASGKKGSSRTDCVQGITEMSPRVLHAVQDWRSGVAAVGDICGASGPKHVGDALIDEAIARMRLGSHDTEAKLESEVNDVDEMAQYRSPFHTTQTYTRKRKCPNRDSQKVPSVLTRSNTAYASSGLQGNKRNRLARMEDNHTDQRVVMPSPSRLSRSTSTPKYKSSKINGVAISARMRSNSSCVSSASQECKRDRLTEKVALKGVMDRLRETVRLFHARLLQRQLPELAINTDPEQNRRCEDAVKLAQEQEMDLDNERLVAILDFLKLDTHAADTYMCLDQEGIRKSWVQERLSGFGFPPLASSSSF